MDGVDGDYAALAQAAQSADDDLAAGGEGDGAVELNRWTRILVADPGCAGGYGCFAMRFAAGNHVDLAVPMLQDLDGEARGAAKAEEADAFAGLDAGHAQAAEADDARAEQRGDVGGVRARRVAGR